MIVRMLAAGVLLACLTLPSVAQTDLAAAKAEGKVIWYTSTPIETANKIAKLFEAQTGIRVELFRSGGSAILRRFMQEQQAGRVAVDVLTTSDPAASAALARKGIFLPFKPANFDQVPDAGKDADGAHVAQRLNLITIFARSDKMPEADLPKPGPISPTRNTRASW